MSDASSGCDFVPQSKKRVLKAPVIICQICLGGENIQQIGLLMGMFIKLRFNQI